LDNKEFPKTIWFLWLQGLANAPLVVRQCYESWIKHNPGWNVILLDEKNISDHISIKSGDITPQAFSDILRINLLAKYGGVWVDATCFCNKPLNEWLFDYMDCGFFAFNKPAEDRMISSWFIAADKNNYIINEYQKAVEHYWTTNHGLRSFETSKWFRFDKYLQRRDTQIWFSGFITKILRVYPYFWFHYLFRRIYLADDKIQKTWDSVPKISADIPHKLQVAGLFKELSEEIKEEIDHKISPVYKLTWKYEPSAYKSGTILDYLLNPVE
jgi:hypothetical protein